MLQDAQLFLAVLVVSSVIYATIPRTAINFRRIFLIFVSAALIFSLSQFTLILLLTFSALSIAAICWARYASLLRSWDVTFYWTLRGSATVLTALAFVSADDFRMLGDHIMVFGSGYAYLKTLWVINWAEKSKTSRLSWCDPILSSLFFPIVASGPIERPDALTAEKLQNAVSLSSFLEGAGRVALGLLFIMVLQRGASGLMQIEAVPLFALPPLSLVALYFNFAGYTHVALGAGFLFGLRLTENFNRPWMAKDLPDFWRRWHISLMNFANENVYFPLFKRTKGKIALPIIMTFVFVGLWHGLTFSFLFWGAAHGIGVLGSLRITAWIERRLSGRTQAFARFGNRFFCLYYVAIVWYVSAYVISG